MTILIGRDGACIGAPDLELRRLRSLADDLERIISGVPPTADDLRDAPFLEHWATSLRSAPCLLGQVTGHPHPIGPRIITSDLWVLAPSHGWALTSSRFYRLGRPHPTSVIRSNPLTTH